MSNDADIEAEGASPPPTMRDGEVTTVARGVLIAYFDELARTEGFADIAPKLRRAVLDDGQFNDAAIKAALFPDSA
jgi:hypothetical protein